MKKLIPIALCLIYLSSYAQDTTANFDGHNWKAPYYLATPKGWGIERFLLPAGFAPEITYKGVEDIRFTPGWAKPTDEQYWTYAFLWYLDSLPQVNEKIIADNLKYYYTGLVKSNTDTTKITPDKIIPVITSIQKAATGEGDIQTYTGSIRMTDYMQGKTITLNCRVHLTTCKELNKAILFYELSPKPFAHKNWTSMRQLWSGFRCKKG